MPRGLAVHVVLDNLSAHMGPEVEAWLAQKRQARWHLHFVPTSSSWLNLVERWFADLTERRLRRGVFTSVGALTDALTAWAASWNEDPKPFVWHKAAEEIIEKVQRGRAALHQVKSATASRPKRMASVTLVPSEKPIRRRNVPPAPRGASGLCPSSSVRSCSGPEVGSGQGS